MRVPLFKLAVILAFGSLILSNVAIAQNALPAATSINPFGALFDKDPTKSDSEIRYNSSDTAGYGHIISGHGLNSSAITGANPDSVSNPTDQPQEVRIVDGVPVISRRNDVSGVEWEDMNNFSRHGSTEFPEEKLHNELKKPMPERRPFGDRMKEISNYLKGTAPE